MFVEQGRTHGSVVEDLVLWAQRNAAALSDGARLSRVTVRRSLETLRFLAASSRPA